MLGELFLRGVWRTGGVVVKEEVGCLRWYGELMDTRVLDGGQNLYVRVDAFELGT